MNAKYPGIPSVIHGNGAVAQVMGHVCGGVIGYPITPSTEISEIYEAFRSAGGCNVWGKHPFFFEPEGEHSAQSGALGASLTGGKFISNASSSQGILYGLESHYVTVGKKAGGFVLQVAARVVSKHSLNVMAGHDDVYALLSSGYTILFGSNPQEAADLAAISYKVSAMSLIPVANAMDGFATSHMLSEALMPEPELLRDFLGDPAGRIKCPTVAQEMLFGAKGRVFQLKQYLARNDANIVPSDIEALKKHLDANADAIEADNDAKLIDATLQFVPEELRGQWKRQWINAPQKGTRQLVPAMVDIDNPGLTGGVQNQPDFQAGAVDHRTHFGNAVPRFVKEAMDEYAALTGREYKPVMSFMADDAEHVVVGLGSVTDDAEAVAAYLRSQGKKVGVVSIKMLQPFPEAELVAALKGKTSVTVLERSDVTALTSMVTQALCKARENGDAGVRHTGIPALDKLPKLTTAIFGLGGHDLQPRDLIACFANMEQKDSAPFVYLGTQFFTKNASPRMEALQNKLKAAYPETQFMALETGVNPNLLPPSAFRIRFHSVGGYGTIASGKLLTDILAGALDMHSKSAPKYGSEKSGAPTNYYITLSPETVKITNAELEDVEVVISPDHKAFVHTNPLRGLVAGGTFILQSNLTPLEVWRDLPAKARQTIRDKKIKFYVIDAFAVAKRHAPTAELETRMMGIAFIGAVCGNVDRVVADASQEAMLNKIRQQISKKFGAKGGDIVEGNMSVIREGLEATHKVDYDAADYGEDAVKAAPKKKVDVSISASMCRIAAPASASGFLDPEYYDDVLAGPFRDGTIADAPVLPGMGMFIPPGSAAGKDKGLFRRNVPEFKADLCTGCMECALVCPDAAIPNAVHDIHELLLTAIKQLDIAPAQQEALRGSVPALTEAVREVYRAGSDKAFSDVVAQASETLEANATLKRNFGKLAAALSVYPVAKTRPFFDAMEKSQPGSGGLYSVSVDPWKCTGCLECIDVCGPGALIDREQDQAVLENVQARFEFLSRTPNTPARFFDGATKPDGETKRLMLDRANYYATTGGHGACRGCGEVTAIRLVTSTNHAIHDKRRKEHTRELEGLIEQLTAKRAQVASDAARAARIDATLKTLEKRLYLYESGPTGNGPSGMVIANATGCSSVYASTFPFNPYTDPWVNSLFQDTPAVAKGIFEGLTAQAKEDFRALRTAKLELADQYNADKHDGFFRFFDWNQFTPEERAMLPTVLSMGGDGATYDIGFGALSRLLATKTPIKVVVLNTGAYSNTGGQTSTASLTGQDSDLSRFGVAQAGKQESRKELGLIASFHPNVFVVQTATALQGHFLKNVLEFLNHTSSPAVLDVYTPCQAEHGIGDAVANRQARLAVESRMNPVFVHDPRKGTKLNNWFALDGNPEADQDWASQTIEYIGDDGKPALLKTKLTPADFAHSEVRFRKQFKPLKKDADALPVDEYVALDAEARAGKTPFIYATDGNKKLVRLSVADTVIALVEERRKYWRTLQYLGGYDIRVLDDSHRVELEALQHQYEDSVNSRETSLDQIARGMSELAASSNAPSNGFAGLLGGLAAAPAAAPANGAKQATNGSGAPIGIAESDLDKCTNCKSCYQDVPEVFELTKIMVDGAAKDVAHVIPGVFGKLKVTPELSAKLSRAASNCDAEIIR